MAGILSRFKDIMSSNINALLDKVEDPMKMIDQYLRNLESDLGKTDQPPGQPHPRGAGRKRSLCSLPALRAGHIRVFLWLCGRVEFGPGTGRVESLSGNYPQYGP